MKVAQFTEIYRPQVSGVTTSVMELNKALVKAGHKVHVFTLGETTRDEDYQGVKEHYYARLGQASSGAGGDRRAIFYTASPWIREVDNVFRTEKFDILHIHIPTTIGLNALRMAKRYRIPVVITCHGFNEEYVRSSFGSLPFGWVIVQVINFLSSLYFHWYYNKCDAVIAPSLHTKILVESYGVENVYVVPTGIDPKKFHPAPRKEVAAFRKKYGIGKGKFVLYLGRISLEKNLGLLVRRAKDIRAKIILCGSGPSTEQLKALIREERAGSRVKLLGFLPDKEVAACYSSATVFAMPSLSETQGLTVIESMACRTPVVLFDSATAESVKHGESGLVAKTEDEFVDYINLVLSNNGLRNRIGRVAYAEAKKHSYEAFGRDVSRIYRSLATKSRK